MRGCRRKQSLRRASGLASACNQDTALFRMRGGSPLPARQNLDPGFAATNFLLGFFLQPATRQWFTNSNARRVRFLRQNWAITSYNRNMATGWESKSVLEQQLSTQTPFIEAEKERISREKAIRTRELQTLTLSCARVREQLQRSQSSRYSELLQHELHHLEDELARKR